MLVARPRATRSGTAARPRCTTPPSGSWGCDWRYEAIDVEPERFAEVVRGMPAQGFAGANVTIPHKLRGARGRRHGERRSRRSVGAANTLVFARRRGSTPTTPMSQGFLTALRERAPEAPRGHAGAGAGRRRRRPRRRLRALARRAPPRSRSGTATPSGPRRSSPTCAAAGTGTPAWPQRRPRAVHQTDVLVNATSVGMVEPRLERPEAPGDRIPSRSYRFRPMNWAIG